MSSENLNQIALPSKECCEAGYKIPTEVYGTYQHLGDVDCYVVGSGNKYVILNPDGFGYQFHNLKVLADSIAKSNHQHVIIPDLFVDKSLTPETIESKTFDWGAWMKNNPPSEGIRRSNSVIDQLIKENQSNTDFSVQVIGYCYGAVVVEGQLIHYPQIKSGIMSHASLVSTEKAEQIPKGKYLLINCAEVDNAFTPSLREKYVEILKKNGVHVKTIDYPNTVHGFCAKPKDDSDHALKMMKLALDNTIAALKEHA